MADELEIEGVKISRYWTYEETIELAPILAKLGMADGNILKFENYLPLVSKVIEKSLGISNKEIRKWSLVKCLRVVLGILQFNGRLVREVAEEAKKITSFN